LPRPPVHLISPTSERFESDFFYIVLDGSWIASQRDLRSSARNVSISSSKSCLVFYAPLFGAGQA
jgi:hypothetical protein